jgi:hypothetical protein
MTTPDQPALWLALVHHPVLNRESKIVTTAITNLDVHDIARAARTYNVKGYFVITPIERQRELASAIVSHWREGHGAQRVPERGEALQLVSTAATLAEAIEEITARAGQAPLVVATCARPGRSDLAFPELRQRLTGGRPVLLLLGTGWGLADEVFAAADHVVEPIDLPDGDYNHLSVRSAAAIMLDRLLAMRG